jgi:hypothetical protein
MKSEGYVKFYKSITGSTFWDTENGDVLKTYIALLCNSNYADHNYKGHTVHTGEWLGSKSKLADIARTTRTTVSKHLAILAKHGFIVYRQVNSRGLWLITLKNYTPLQVFNSRAKAVSNVSEPAATPEPLPEQRTPEKPKTNKSTNSDDYYSQCVEVIIDGVKKYKGPDGEIWDT